jgi:hypothetical protein
VIRIDVPSRAIAASLAITDKPTPWKSSRTQGLTVAGCQKLRHPESRRRGSPSPCRRTPWLQLPSRASPRRSCSATVVAIRHPVVVDYPSAGSKIKLRFRYRLACQHISASDGVPTTDVYRYCYLPSMPVIDCRHIRSARHCFTRFQPCSESTVRVHRQFPHLPCAASAEPTALPHRGGGKGSVPHRHLAVRSESIASRDLGRVDRKLAHR